MEVRLIAESIELVGVGASGWFWRKRLARFFRWIFEGDQFFSVLETFFNEAAVLWFVFPFLDTLYRTRKAGDAPAPNIFKVMAQSWIVALILFILAIIAKKFAKKQRD
ncbi:MAG: hypothetical protein ACYCSP_00035 [Acidobacteriaceae bacterium]